MTELTITTGEVPIAAVDHGGDGDPLLLLHGAGSNLAALRPLADALAGRHRVVAVDLRGHGRSGDGPWSWDAVIGDLSAVVKALSLDPPAVVGHSLGGMVAAQWAALNPDCPGVVNLDGNPSPTRPEQLAEMDPAEAEDALRRLHDTFAAMAAALPDDRLALADLQTAIARFDLLGTYRRATSPVLHVLATEDLPEQQAFQELYAAYRTGLRADLETLAAQRPQLRILPLPGASHALAAEHPTRLAALVSAFLIGEPLPAWDG